VTATEYRCDEKLRAEAVRDATTVNGIDYLEVLAGQTTLAVHFLHPLPGEPGSVPASGGTGIDRRHVVIEGGDRVRGLRAVSTSTSGEVLTVTVTGPGDFSTYRLRLENPADGRTPTGFDPQLGEVEFSFKAGCPIRFDCRPKDTCPPPVATSAVRDYLAKDYDSFRQLMLDRLATTLPEWRERNPSDLQVALVELLAFAADRLSYEQDAVATEAHLGTARRRVSVRRHARLLGYRMHEGCAARAFVHVKVPSAMPIEEGRRFLTGPLGHAETLGFQSLHALAAKPNHNEIGLYTWTDQECCLPKGATRATLARRPQKPLSLDVGDFLLLEEVRGSTSGQAADVDRTHRHVVRLTEVRDGEDPLDGTKVVEVAWADEDALPFPFCVSAMTEHQGVSSRQVCGVARGNIVLVEHGVAVPVPEELTTEIDVAGRWRPMLSQGRPTWAVRYEEFEPPGPDGTRRRYPAAALLDLDPRAALPWVAVEDEEDNDFDPVLDLLGSFAEDAHFVVETEDDGTATLRFGDGTYGKKPNPAATHLATYRLGHGSSGNVGPEAINVLEPPEPDVEVRNPLPATGGVDPEPTEQVRTDAPHAFRVQERAVTEDDYGTILAERKRGVQRATGRMRWTGSWYSAFVTVDRVGGCEVDAAYRTQVSRFLDGYRMAGVDVDVSSPVPVPLEIELSVCARPDRFNTDVEADVLDALSSRVLPDGRRGMFHPDNFTFGTPVYLSRVYAAVLAVPGVGTVQATKFRRFSQADHGELANGVLRVRDLEIAQLANDPDVPERGLLTVSVAGGR
jgi:hypothetical protein